MEDRIETDLAAAFFCGVTSVDLLQAWWLSPDCLQAEDTMEIEISMTSSQSKH